MKIEDYKCINQNEEHQTEITKIFGDYSNPNFFIKCSKCGLIGRDSPNDFIFYRYEKNI
jgi:hypothetical protein